MASTNGRYIIMYTLIAIIINIYLMGYREFYSVVWDITERFYINSLLNYCGNWLLLIPTIILLISLIKTINSPILTICSNMLTVLTILSLCGISISELIPQEHMDFILAKVHTADIRVKHEILKQDYNTLLEMVRYQLSADKYICLKEHTKILYEEQTLQKLLMIKFDQIRDFAIELLKQEDMLYNETHTHIEITKTNTILTYSVLSVVGIVAIVALYYSNIYNLEVNYAPVLRSYIELADISCKTIYGPIGHIIEYVSQPTKP